MNHFVPDYYKQLGIPRNASPEQIKDAYRIKIKTTHPDKGGNEADAQNLNNIMAILSNENKRADYNRRLLNYERIKITKQSSYQQNAKKHTVTSTIKDQSRQATTSNPADIWNSHKTELRKSIYKTTKPDSGWRLVGEMFLVFADQYFNKLK